jgi:transcriptional regulator with XRE-family HTH domain
MEEIRELREIAGLTQFEMAKLSGIERSRLSLAECRHVVLAPAEIAKFKAVLLAVLGQRAEQVQEVLSKLSAAAKEAVSA